jgi:ankyrin repeat protein
LLLDAGADVELRGRSEETPLHCAVRSEKVDLVRFLLDRGANVNAPREDNETPLMSRMWAERPNPAIIRLLIERGTDLTQRDSWGRTALEMADHLGKVEAAKVLRHAERR